MKYITPRIGIYFIAFVLRLFLALFFYDKLDPYVFQETVKDIIIYHHNIYYEGSLQVYFNYFPLAYLVILPGAAIYYLFLPQNIYLQRVMVKLPFILGDLWLAKEVHKLKSTSVDNTLSSKLVNINNYELFILFNPFIIFTSSIKGQFDIFSAILILFSALSYLKGNYIKSGLYLGLSMMIKPYGIIMMFFFGFAIMLKYRPYFLKYLIGIILGTVPILIIGAILNYQGMLYHSTWIQLERNPNGISITSLLYFSLLFFSKYLGLTSQLWIDLILNLLTILLFASLLYLLYDFYKSDRSDVKLIGTTIKAFIVFFLLNKVFYLQYLVPLFALLVVYKSLQNENFSDLNFSWEVLLLPIIIMYRLVDETPVSTRNLFGSDWIFIFWALMLILHISIFIILKRYKMPILPSQKYKILYLILIMLYILNLPIQIYFEQFKLTLLPNT